MHLLLHISDIHFGSGRGPKPFGSVVAAVRSLNCAPCTFTLAITGDVAYSGKEEEYAKATRYFSELLRVIKIEFDPDCDVVIVPGNHDCDFPEDSAVRNVVIERIRSEGELPDSRGMVGECIAVQEPFFRWAETMEEAPADGHRLAWVRERCGSDGVKVAFRMLNSAWMSSVKEAQGRLYFPLASLPEEVAGADVRVTVLHHPFSWFSSTNGRDLRRALEATSDLILTGHEHDYDSFDVVRDDDSVAYVEGGMFGGHDREPHSFNVIQVEPEEARYRVFRFQWGHGSFVPDCSEVAWRHSVCKGSTVAREQLLSAEMRSFLADPGLQLTHPAKALQLEDIFVAPELRRYEQTGDPQTGTTRTISSDLCINQLLDDRYGYLLGEAQCGKTALAKMLFLRALRQGLTPVLIQGEQVRRPEPKDLEKLISHAVQEQYGTSFAERFWQLGADRRALIVDDFGLAKLNAQGRAKLTDWLKRHFGAAMLFGGDLTQVEDLIATQGGDGDLAGFKRYEIMPLGHLGRDDLIEKWITLGREHELQEDDVQYQLRDTARAIDRVLGNNLLPANPVYVLILLQQLEAQVPLDMSAGSYGYFYETVVTMALRRSSRSPEDVDAKYTYLSELAWHVFSQGTRDIDGDELDSFTRTHLDRFRLTVGAGKLRNEILESRLLHRRYGKYGFAYRYSMYYFVARYMRDNDDQADVQRCIEEAAEQIHREDYANILIFYTYLTKSKATVGLVLEKARSLFSDVEPCNLAEHVSFIGRLQDRVPEVVLPDVDVKEERRIALRNLDAVESRSESTEEDPGESEGEGDRLEAELMLSLNRAIKTLQVLGQILRNFSGSLPGELKLEITGECFNLALRVLNSFYILLERHLDTALGALADLFGKNLSELPDRKRVEAARRFIFLISELVCLGTLRRISHAVGSEELVRTYEDLESADVPDSRASRFVQLSLRLDHCRQFPEKRILGILNEVESDGFGLTLLRMLVTEHFRQFPRPYRTQQSICQKLGIVYRPALPSPKKALPPRRT